MRRGRGQKCRLRYYRTRLACFFPVSTSASASAFASSAPIDQHLVRRLFAAPERVAESDFLRREISGRMLERLELIKIQPRKLLDAGCGEGADLGLLGQMYHDAELIGLDASLPSLFRAHARHRAALSSVHRLLSRWFRAPIKRAPAGLHLAAGDFAQLPLPSNSLDLIWSNLALHWHSQPDRVFVEWRRVLSTDGLLMFSCFGPDTFKELRAAFADADAAHHALSFVDMHDFGDMLVNAGYATPVMDMELITVTYDNPRKLLSDVRAWGGNPHTGRRKGLMGKNAWQAVIRSLENQRRSDGKIGLTFEVIYGHAFRPVSRSTSAGEAIVRFLPPKS